MKKKSPSQLMELFLSIADELGFESAEDIAGLADAGPENVANWRSGAVKEFKNQKFQAARENLLAVIRALRVQAGHDGDARGLNAIEIEEGSSPADLQRQFRNRVIYDYLGHRFLYFDPQGALAWENLIKGGYEQNCWLDGVADCADTWLATKKDGQGQTAGPIARALGLGRRDRPRGLDVISLGPGEGGKEVRFFRRFFDVENTTRQSCQWVTFAPVDVSIPLLLTAAESSRRLFAQERTRGGGAYRTVLPFCADFEEGKLTFAQRLRTSHPSGSDGVRLILVLGNVLGNLRDEESFVRQKLWTLARPGDLVWIEIGLRPIESEPLYAMTQRRPDQPETASEANRRLLLEGPYRRLAAAFGRPMPDLELRVWVREDDDASRVPGSCNFCHDLIVKDERRAVTMLYSRRYDFDAMPTWFESLGFSVEGISRTRDSKNRVRVGHFLLRRL